MLLRLVLLASVVLAGFWRPADGQSLPASQPGTPPAFTFAVITDTHIAQPADLARFRRFLRTIQDGRIDFLLLLGDVCGHAPEYLPQVREVIEHSGLTVHVVPGNHDDNYGRNPEWFDTAFAKPYYSFDHKGWHFVMSDSQSPPPAPWLTRQLAAADGRPIVFCQHYPPTSKQMIDAPWAELAKCPNVELVLHGHEHRRRTGKSGPVGYEVLANCFFTGKPDAGHYYIVDACQDGKTRIRESNLDSLKLREPADHVPAVTILQPRENQILRNGTAFAGSATDDKALKRVEYSVDFGPWQPASGTQSWKFQLNTAALADGHHLFRVRSIDSADQASIDLGTMLALVENHPPLAERAFRFQQGVDGYDGCTAVTVRQPDKPKNASGEQGEASDLECWTSKDGQGEFCEFYLRFDLTKARIPANARIKRATLMLYGSRQNQIDDQGKLCHYFVAVLQQPWKADLTFATRPDTPGWLSPADAPPHAALSLTWPYLGGRQMLIPPQPVVIDLAPILDTLQQWLRDPAANCGLLFSPAGGRAYNMSVKGSRYKLATLRPQLQIELENAAE